MTDNEKALDILQKFDFFYGQRAGRELWNDKPADIQNEDIDNFKRDVAFLKDFINRQKAEIERLQKHNTKMARKHYQDGKADAVKEFAERLKVEMADKKYKYVTETNYSKTVNAVIDACIGATDNLVKEFTEGVPK